MTTSRVVGALARAVFLDGQVIVTVQPIKGKASRYSKMSQQNGNASWAQLPQVMSKSVSSLQKTLDHDIQWQAFINTKAIIDPITLGVASAGGDAILVLVTPGANTSVSSGDASKADFTLVALGEQWERFFQADPEAPFQSFVGLQVCSALDQTLDGTTIDLRNRV